MTTAKSLEKAWVPATKGFHSPFCFDHCCVDKQEPEEQAKPVASGDTEEQIKN